MAAYPRKKSFGGGETKRLRAQKDLTVRKLRSLVGKGGGRGGGGGDAEWVGVDTGGTHLKNFATEAWVGEWCMSSKRNSVSI